jgi:MerR family transcriptional regulator, mercuric resistance operon regulatory protein
MPLLAPATIAGLARKSGVDIESIRTYERLGLLPKPRRRQGRSGRVAYHREHLERLTFIWRARKLGFSLDAIADMLGLGGGLRTCADIDRIAERHLAEVRTRAGQDEVRRLESALGPLLSASPRSGLAKDSPIIVMLSDSP